MKRRLAAVFVTATVAGVAPAVAPVAGPVAPSSAAAHTCSSRYTAAVMPDGSHKCLGAGEFCSRKGSWERVYRHKGFYCPPSRHLRYR